MPAMASVTLQPDADLHVAPRPCWIDLSNPRPGPAVEGTWVGADEDAVGGIDEMTAETAGGIEISIRGNVRHIAMNEVESVTGTGGIVTGTAATAFEAGDRLRPCPEGGGHP